MKKVAVIGERGLDVFVYGKVTRLNPEAPTPVFQPDWTSQNYGMAFNVFANINSMGLFEVTFTGNEIPIVKKRYVDEKSNYVLIRIDENDSCEGVSSGDQFKGLDMFDCVVVSDYNKGLLSEKDLFEISVRSKFSILDTKKPLSKWMQSFSYIKLNEQEYNNPNHDKEVLDIVKDKLLVTLGERGTLHKGIIYPTEKVEVMDVSGAGDTFVASFAASILCGNSVERSIENANKCASIAVSHRGVHVPNDMAKIVNNL